MESSRTFEVSQANGKVVVLTDDDGRRIALPTNRLKIEVKAGDVLSIPYDDEGTPFWALAELSRAKLNEDSETSDSDTPPEKAEAD